MNKQQNHHCLITAAGRDWWIVKAIPGHLKLTRHIEGGYLESVWMDTAKVDWTAYTKDAVDNDYSHYKIG